MSNSKNMTLPPLEGLTLMNRFLFSEAVEDQQFFEDPSDEVADRSESERIRRMQRHVKSLKANAEVGVRYMNAWEERILDREEAREEAREEERAKMGCLFKVLKSNNRIDDYERAIDDAEYCEQLFKEYNIE